MSRWVALTLLASCTPWDEACGLVEAWLQAHIDDIGPAVERAEVVACGGYRSRKDLDGTAQIQAEVVYYDTSGQPIERPDDVVDCFLLYFDQGWEVESCR